MSRPISFNLSPLVLEWARTSMGYTIAEAAKRAGVSMDRYEAWEKGNSLPTYRQLEDLAEKVYKRPIAILFLSKPPNENPIQKDFRNLSNSDLKELSPNLRLALRRAKRYQFILEEVIEINEQPKFTKFRISTADDPAITATKFRQFIVLPVNEQKSWKFEDAFLHFKQKIEELGIFIFQFKLPIQEVRAFCLTGKFPIIVLNTEDSKNARIFSLFHEVCHIFLNINDIFKDSQSVTISKDYELIERFCNQFAASFLVPDDSFELDVKLLQGNSKVLHTIQELAKSYNVSNEVIARKMLSRRLITDDFFWSMKKSWDFIAKSAKDKANEQLKNQEPAGRDQGIKIVSEKGKPYVSSVINAFNQGLISSSDLSNYLETKLNHLPKIIRRL